jgi:hypothetical protein
MPSEPRVAAIAHVIQLAVAPVFLLMAIGGMLGVLAGRISRIIDRARTLELRLEAATPERAAAYRVELGVLARRARLMNIAISLTTVAALLIATVIAALFAGAFMALDASMLVGMLFVAATVTFCAALVCFLREIYLTTSNLRIGPR